MLEPGHRLALVLDRGGYRAEPYAPTLRVQAGDATGSQLLLELVVGTFGGLPAPADVPPRPFLPP